MNKEYTKSDVINLLINLNFEFSRGITKFIFSYKSCRVYIPISIDDDEIDIETFDYGHAFWNDKPNKIMRFLKQEFYRELRILKIEKLLTKE